MTLRDVDIIWTLLWLLRFTSKLIVSSWDQAVTKKDGSVRVNA